MIKSFMSEIMNRQVSEEFLPITYYIDNKSLIDSIQSTETATEKGLQKDILLFVKRLS